MYSLPDFSSFQPSCSRDESLASSYYPPTSPFLTLGSGFNEKPGLRKPPDVNRKPIYFVKDQSHYRFCCDTCNKSFSLQRELDKHLSEHVKCSFEGCFFQGHTKIVELHKKMQHYTGLAKLISNLNTPEEIKRWREERKRNFPTAAKRKKKQEEMAARKARGEILDTQHFGKRKMRKTRCNSKDRSPFVTRRKRKRQRFSKGAKRVRLQNDGNTKFPPQQAKCQPFGNTVQKSKISTIQIERTDSKCNLVKFPGTRAIEMIDETDIKNEPTEDLDKCQEILQQRTDIILNDNTYSDEEIEFVEQRCKNEDEIAFVISDSEAELDTCLPCSKECNTSSISNPITSSICDEYADVSTNGNSAALSFFTIDKEIEDSDDDVVIPVQPIIKSEPIDHTEPLHATVGGALGSLMAAYSDTESEPETKCVAVAKPKPVENTKQPTEPINKQPIEEKDYSFPLSHPKVPYVNERRLTLLEKLFANEIRHERNVIFQCIHYIVKNNFFQKCD